MGTLRHSLSSRAIGAALFVAVGLLLIVAAQAPPLGPVDGVGLRPDDMSRVAVGRPAPDFTLEDARGRRVTLSGFRGAPVVLIFYRGHW